MSENNKAIVEKVNTAFSENNIENFLSQCADNVVWNMVGDKTTTGKEAIRKWMSSMGPAEPPKFTVEKLFAEGDSVVCHGDMTMKGEDGVQSEYSYCDVYEFSGDRIVKLDSFVIKKKNEGEKSDVATA